MKKKIAFVGNSSFSMYNFRLGVMTSFLAKGYEVFVLAPIDEYSVLFERQNLIFIPIDVDCKGQNPLKDLKLLFAFYNIYKKQKFDFIFHYTIKPVIYGSIASRFAKINSIAVTTGLGYTFSKEGLINSIVRLLYKFALLKVKNTCFLNNSDQKIFVEQKIVESKKTFVLPGEGVDINHFRPEPRDQSQTFAFLLFSRLLKDKGIYEYVEAAKKLKKRYSSIEILLLGKTDNENPENIPIEVVRYWADQGYIKFLGDTMDVRSYISQADCIVLPSYYREGIPRCLMEAMSMERPIITTDNVGCIELINDDFNGFLCKQRDSEDLMIQMEKMFLLSVEERLQMGMRGRQIIETKYEESKIISLYHNLFEQYN